MLDVISLLNAPLPWDRHGTTAPVPDHVTSLIERPDAARRFFLTATDGGIDGVEWQRLNWTRNGTPGLVRALEVSTLEEIQGEVDDAVASGQPAVIRLTGQVEWTRTLVIDGAHHVALDLAGLRIDVANGAAPLITIARSSDIALRGLRVAQRHLCGIDVNGCTRVALEGVCIAGAQEAAIRLSGGTRDVQIDRGGFLRNPGHGVLILGEVAGVSILRTQFEGPTQQAFIRAAATMGAQGYPALSEAEPGRDGLTVVRPCDIRIVENRFGQTEDAGILADGVQGIWVERNDFARARGGAFRAMGQVAGLMLADNRFASGGEQLAPHVTIEDAALFCVFRNSFQPGDQTSILLAGSFGGGLLAANTFLASQIAPHTNAPLRSAIRLAPAQGEGGAFLSITLMLNIVRGGFDTGFEMLGTIPRLFLFDNHFYGMTGWSIKSTVAQPNVSSLNNWSPERSLNIRLSDSPIENARPVWELTLP